MGEDQIPPNLIKTAATFLVEPLTDIINSCFSTSTFPDLANRASVTPIDKGGTDIHIYKLQTSQCFEYFFKNNGIINI